MRIGYNSTLSGKLATKGVIFSSSYLLFSLIFWLYPVIWLGILLFSRWSYIGTPQFAGVANLVRVFQNELFWKSVMNTLRFILVFLPMVLTLSLLFALGLKQIKVGKTFVALSFLLANVSSGVAYSVVFAKLFSSEGPINNFLYKYFSIDIPWLTHPRWAIFSIAIIVTWKFVGYYGLILYAGMNAIPTSLYEAGSLDGASKVRQFFTITIPLINNQIVMIIVLAITLSFGIFTEPYMITGGGPMQSTMTPMLVMYETAFQRTDPTLAATMAIIIAMISFSVIKITRLLVERKVELV